MREKAVKKDFAHGSLVKIILRLAIPILIAEIVHVLYSLVDRMYIGHIPDIGTPALTGIGLTLPLVSLISAFANLCSTGGSPLCSIARGENNIAEAERIQENAFTLLLVFSVALTAVLFAFKRPILTALGGNDETLPIAIEYFEIYVLGTIFSMISLGCNPYINMQGFSIYGMFTVILGATTNIVLDPLFIFTFGWGVRGAAAATVLSQMLSAAWVLKFCTGNKAILRIRKLRLEGTYIRKIFALGLSGFTLKATNSITQAVVNITLRSWGGAASTLYIGSMSIINSIREVVSQPIVSVAHAAQPVLGFNFGAKQYHRARQCILFMTGMTLAYNIIAWPILQFFPRPLIRIFTDDEELIILCIRCLKIYFGAYMLMAFQQAGQNTFIGLNYPKYAVFFSLFRKVILVAPLTLILPHTRLGVEGVFYAEMISQIVGALSCYSTMLIKVWSKLKGLEKSTAQDPLL